MTYYLKKLLLCKEKFLKKKKSFREKSEKKEQINPGFLISSFLVSSKDYLLLLRPFFFSSDFTYFFLSLTFNYLSIICGSRYISSSSSPVDMNILSSRKVVISILWQHSEGMSTEVISLSLQQVSG